MKVLFQAIYPILTFSYVMFTAYVVLHYHSIKAPLCFSSSWFLFQSIKISTVASWRLGLCSTAMGHMQCEKLSTWIPVFLVQLFALFRLDVLLILRMMELDVTIINVSIKTSSIRDFLNKARESVQPMIKYYSLLDTFPFVFKVISRLYFFYHYFYY